MENKKFIDLLKANDFLFPSSENEIIEFEKNNDIESETPIDWNDPSAILKRGIINIEKLTVSEFEENEIHELKMAARKGEQSISKDILDKMKSKHKNGDK